MTALGQPVVATARPVSDPALQPTVLVVEDEGSFIEALSIGLAREGFRVQVARDGVTALSMFDAVRPDVVLLHVLLANADRAMTRGDLIDLVWGFDHVGDTKTLDVHVERLRARVEPDPTNPARIVTIRGLGYKYVS